MNLYLEYERNSIKPTSSRQQPRTLSHLLKDISEARIHFPSCTINVSLSAGSFPSACAHPLVHYSIFKTPFLNPTSTIFLCSLSQKQPPKLLSRLPVSNSSHPLFNILSCNISLIQNICKLWNIEKWPPMNLLLHLKTGTSPTSLH